jgi:hypothetical protein
MIISTAYYKLQGVSLKIKRLITVTTYQSFPLLHINTDGDTQRGILRSCGFW